MFECETGLTLVLDATQQSQYQHASLRSIKIPLKLKQNLKIFKMSITKLAHQHFSWHKIVRRITICIK